MPERGMLNGQSKVASLEGLVSVIGDAIVQVNVTPSHGLGDALFPSPSDPAVTLFVTPFERTTTFSEFAATLDPYGKGPVSYYSSQNSNVHTECSKLLTTNLLPPTLPTFEAAFSSGPPQAVNLWIGDGRAVTSMHRDPFENVYCVLAGVKIFVLVPPYMGGCLYEEFHKTGEFTEAGEIKEAAKESGGNNQEAASTSKVKWVAVDAESAADREDSRYPLLHNVKPITVEVKAGECLYLPAMWYHKVKSRGVSISVNYW